MSAIPPKADIGERNWHVRFVPEADICGAAIHGDLLAHGAEFLPAVSVGCKAWAQVVVTASRRAFGSSPLGA
jgi:hypothetical protein